MKKPVEKKKKSDRKRSLAGNAKNDNSKKSKRKYDSGNNFNEKNRQKRC